MTSSPSPRTRLKIRSMTMADLPSVLEIERAAYPFPWTKGIFLDCLDSKYDMLLALHAGKIIGHGALMIAVGEAHVLNLCVAPTFQKRGIGQLLLKALLDVARDKAAEAVFLEVRESNLAARHLYEESGFVEVGVRHGYYPTHDGREDAIVLALQMALPFPSL